MDFHRVRSVAFKHCFEVESFFNVVRTISHSIRSLYFRLACLCVKGSSMQRLPNKVKTTSKIKPVLFLFYQVSNFVQRLLFLR